jgi:hypothetical protein
VSDDGERKVFPMICELMGRLRYEADHSEFFE